MLPTYYISHGGGPWPYVDGPMRVAHARLEAALSDMPRQFEGPPKAVLLISAHWEEQDFTVMGSAHPRMLYDYGGFPEQTYRVRYDAPGSPQLARRVQELVQAAGTVCRIDTERGFDHGAFVPMGVVHPSADVPVVQLSLKAGYNPRAHLELGRLLAPLRNEGVLIIGSGSSYHNLRQMGLSAKVPSKLFDDWLAETVLASTTSARTELLASWSEAPSARVAHPREEHLLPLMVVAGASYEDMATRVYHEDAFMGSASVSSFRFDATRPSKFTSSPR